MLLRFLNNAECHRRKTVRSLAFVLLFLFIATILLSTAFIVVYTGHDCIGADCPVCAIFKNIKSLFEQIGRAISNLLSQGTLLLALSILVPFSYLVILPSTLLDDKVKLNN